MSQPGAFVFRRRNAVFLAICLGGLALLLLVAIVPLMLQQRRLDQELAGLQAEAANQAQYQTGVGLVDGLLATIDQQPTPQVVRPIPLSPDDTGLIIRDIHTLAQQTSLEVTSVEPLLDKKNSWQSLTVSAELQGLFPDLRQLLLKLLALPYVKGIDRLEIHPGESGLIFRLTYTILLT